MSIKFNEIDNAKALYTQGLAIQKVYWRDNLIFPTIVGGDIPKLPITKGLKHYFDFNDKSMMELASDEMSFKTITDSVGGIIYKNYHSNHPALPLYTVNPEKGLTAFYSFLGGNYYYKATAVSTRAEIPPGGTAFILCKFGKNVTTDAYTPLLGNNSYKVNPSTREVKQSTYLYECNTNYYWLQDAIPHSWCIVEIENCSYRVHSIASLNYADVEITIAEIIIYDSFISDVESYQIRDYLSQKWLNTEPTEVPEDVINNDSAYWDKYYTFRQDFSDPAQMTLNSNNEITYMKCLDSTKCATKSMSFGPSNSGLYVSLAEWGNGLNCAFFDNTTSTEVKQVRSFYYLNGYSVGSTTTRTLFITTKLDESLKGYRVPIFGSRVTGTEIYYDGVENIFKTSIGTVRKVYQPNADSEDIDLSKPMIIVVDVNKSISYGALGGGIKFETTEEFLPFSAFRGYMLSLDMFHRFVSDKEADGFIKSIHNKWFNHL